MKRTKFHVDRRRFLATSAAATFGAISARVWAGQPSVPEYLREYAALYRKDPHAAAIEWFRNAKFGLFMHYGLYSLLGGEWQGKMVTTGKGNSNLVAEWIQFHARIPVAEYAKLADRFTAERFDADFITDLAIAAGMKYVNITTRHHDSFCLFRTKQTDFNSLNTPARRDLVAELADACRRKGLGLFLYYSHGRDWRHPHAPTLAWCGNARPHYESPQPEYIPDDQVDVRIYADFMEKQITELLTQYGPIAGIWLDGEGVLKSYAAATGRPLSEVCELMRVPQLYATIRRLQPQCLISYKRGVNGDEDFLTPERKSFGLEHSGKPLEINTTLQQHSWGYNKYSKLKSFDEIWNTLALARSLPACLLLNTGPLGDGSIRPAEERMLRDVGRRIRKEGWPTAPNVG
ncbi:MAG: alpha-L-fucosidase precursor [Planctomycetota bacterium]|nr:MAG: alpha-L-fucosidase precursor [Planctomycetota bacterium]